MAYPKCLSPHFLYTLCFVYRWRNRWKEIAIAVPRHHNGLLLFGTAPVWSQVLVTEAIVLCLHHVPGYCACNSVMAVLCCAVSHNRTIQQLAVYSERVITGNISKASFFLFLKSVLNVLNCSIWKLNYNINYAIWHIISLHWGDSACLCEH